MHPFHLEALVTLSDAHGKPLAEILHSPVHELLYVRWHGNITGTEVISVATEVIQLQTQYHYPLALNDKSLATGDWSEAMDWLEYEWVPQAQSLGLRAIAYVFSPDLSNQIISMTFFERVRQYVSIQMFYDVPAAWQWLRQHRRPQTSTSPGT
ncbi:hypothetical protein GCM10027346_10930 [Hymenobacter seoulensis]